jgi:hypothetical protein
VSNWNNNGRQHGGFPATVHRQAERELPKQCAHCGAINVKLWLDHVINKAAGGPDTIDNAQWLCTPDHDAKTKAESAQGLRARAARNRHPAESHPGLTR